ncbi:MAG: hypothetical protein E7470_04875 [Ruminococcaceae bacterium]|nr:hypothetical protein [Oscillospiraceae bacterium]
MTGGSVGSVGSEVGSELGSVIGSVGSLLGSVGTEGSVGGVVAFSISKSAPTLFITMHAVTRTATSSTHITISMICFVVMVIPPVRPHYSAFRQGLQAKIRAFTKTGKC